jgi:FMN phosphatase YigB (HAD superfamily)
MDKKTKVYDWSGTLVNIDGFMDWFKANHPALHEQYIVLGANDKELKRRVRPQALAIYEEATNKGLYPVSLMPNAAERLKIDREKGFTRVIFTSSPRDIITQQAKEQGIIGEIDEILCLDDVVREFNLPCAMKEDPSTFKHFTDFLSAYGFCPLISYADDSKGRVEAAANANENLIEQARRFSRIYLFDRSLKLPFSEEKGYLKINDLMKVE